MYLGDVEEALAKCMHQQEVMCHLRILLVLYVVSHSQCLSLAVTLY